MVSLKYIDLEGTFGFLNYIGDSLLVLLLCVFLGKGPLLFIRDAFIELAGGTLQNKKNKMQIEGILEKYLGRDGLLKGNYISKTGSSYLVVAYLNTAVVIGTGVEKIDRWRTQIHTELQKQYLNVMFEIVIV